MLPNDEHSTTLVAPHNSSAPRSYKTPFFYSRLARFQHLSVRARDPDLRGDDLFEASRYIMFKPISSPRNLLGDDPSST